MHSDNWTIAKYQDFYIIVEKLWNRVWGNKTFIRPVCSGISIE